MNYFCYCKKKNKQKKLNKITETQQQTASLDIFIIFFTLTETNDGKWIYISEKVH